jgi:hypothetical protein
MLGGIGPVGRVFHDVGIVLAGRQFGVVQREDRLRDQPVENGKCVLWKIVERDHRVHLHQGGKKQPEVELRSESMEFSRYQTCVGESNFSS